MNSIGKALHPTAVIALMLLALSLASCAADYGDEAAGRFPGEPWDDKAGSDGPVDYLAAAEQALFNHNVARARDFYEDALSAEPGSGRAAAGLATTRLLLVPGVSQVATLLIEDLGARHGLDAGDVIYGRDGYLYWRSRGATWEDQGQFEGIRSILANRLPWSRDKLTSLALFADGLIRPVDAMMDNLLAVADALADIEDVYQIALEDPAFTRLYIPGQVFHDDRLAIVLGRSEIASIQAVLDLVRAMVSFVAAYQHDWTLEEALGSWRQTVRTDDERYVEGFRPSDYTATYLDGHLFRVVAHPERLADARILFKHSLDRAHQALSFGLEETSATTFQWQLIEASRIEDLITLVEALTQAIDGQTPIPFTSPASKLDLSSFFGTGRVLDEGQSWLTRDEDERLILSEQALKAFFIDGVLLPPAAPSELPELDVANPMRLVDDYLDRLQAAFP
jgi:hypothetical protein